MIETQKPSLVIRRRYKASRQRVFDAWTKPEIAALFLGPNDRSARNVEMDVRVGGRYRIVMVKPDGERFIAVGTYRDVRAPQKLVMTWRWEEDDLADEIETLLTLEFNDCGGGETELVLTHEQFASEESRERHNEGWTAIAGQLDRLLQRPFHVAGIDLSGYMVKDASRAIAFYRDVLGLEPSTVYPNNFGAEYELPDGTCFGLWGGGGNVMPFQPSNGVLLAVDDFDAAIANLKSRGIPILFEKDGENCRMAMIADSEGNGVTLHKRKA